MKFKDEVTTRIISTIMDLGGNSKMAAELKRQAITNWIEVYNLWNNILENKGNIQISGDDAQNRSRFINLQGVIESTISSLCIDQKITAFGVIHTQLPPTPLRTNDQNTRDIVAEEIYSDQKRLDTVLTRANILRDYIRCGGVLVCATPRYEDNIEGIDIFNKLKENYKNNLYAQELKHCTTLEHDKSGATYFIKEGEELFIFSIKASQANSPSNSWAMWFGDVTQEQIKGRLNDITLFLKDNEVDISRHIKEQGMESILVGKFQKMILQETPQVRSKL